VPSPKDYFGTLNAPFQWLDLSESETLVSQSTRSTRKPVYQKYQKYQRYQKTSVPEVPEVPEVYQKYQKYQRYQKTRSTSPEIRRSSLEEQKLDFLRSKHTRLLASAKRTSW
jgi:hypothetical protein